MLSEAKFSRPARRLHPASLIFSIGSAAKALLLPGFVFWYFSRGSSIQFWMMLFFVPAVIAALVKYWSFRYRLEAEELIVREGIVTRNERHVPYARIQNIDLVQNPLHRLLRVAEVRLETAGGEKPEAIMRVLSIEAIDRLRARVFEGRRGPVGSGVFPQPVEAPARLLHSLAPRDLLLFGVISNKGMVVVAAMMGLLWQFDFIDKLEDRISPELLDRLRLEQNQLGADNLLAAFAWGIAAVLALLFLMRLLSVAWAFLKFYGFRLHRRGDDLRAERGLLTRISKTIPRHRIQVLATREGPLHRLFGRSSVQVQTAGSSRSEEGQSSGRLWLAPLIAKSEVNELLGEVLPDIPVAEIDWRPISPRAWVRIFRLSLFFLVAILAGSFTIVGWWAVLPTLVFGALAYLNARLYARYAAYAIVPGAVLHRSGWWVRRMRVVRFNKIQSVERTESPFDRRNAMASIRVDVAGAGPIGQGVYVRFIDAAAATGLLARLGTEAGRTSFRW